MGNKSRDGFTFVEILVATALISVVLVMGGGLYTRYEKYSQKAAFTETQEDVRLWLRQKMDCTTTLTNVSGSCNGTEHVPLYDENNAIFVKDADTTPRTAFNKTELYAKCVPDATDPGIVRVVVESLAAGQTVKQPIFDSISPLCILRVDTTDPQICNKYPMNGTSRIVGDTLVVMGSPQADLWDMFYGANTISITYRRGGAAGVQSVFPRPSSGKILVCSGDSDDIWGGFSDTTGLEFIIYTGAGNDRVAGSGGIWRVWGEDGSDFLNTAGEGEMHGGPGGDVIEMHPIAGKSYRIFGDAGNDQILGKATAPGTVVVFGGLGDDILSPPASSFNFLFGEEGNDQVVGGTGNDVVVGGPGNDFMRTNGGKDIMIGGLGTDTMMDGGGAVYIGGTTPYDADETALRALLTEWTSGQPIATRTQNLLNGTGATGGRTLARGTTVTDDTAADNFADTAPQDFIYLFPLDNEFMPRGTRAP